MSIQNQVRENSEDLQAFLKDLDSWEKDMKKKEEELKLLQVTDEQDVPPIRNSLSRSKKKNKQKNKKEVSAKKRVSSYNYKAWEHYDVESELKKMDEEKEEPSGSESSDNEEQLSIQKRQQLALVKKDKGNEFFKNGDYDSAINSYTVGMELDPENALLPANRAMAFLKKEQFQTAENDCNLCLSLDPTYVKAYLRRGTARKALDKTDLARSDFIKVLELEPENKQARLELEKLNKKMDTEEGNKKPLRVGKSDALSQECSSNFLEFEDNSDNNFELAEKEYSSLFLKTESEPFTDEFHEELLTEVKIPSYKPEKLKEKTKKNNDLSSDKNIKQKPSSSKIKENNEYFNGIENVIATLEQTLPPVPYASYQFLRDWKKFSKYPELKYQYLKQFPPEKFLTLFKHNMEPEIFPEILNTLSCFFIENGDDIFPYMKYLSSVGRFNTMLMFMADHEKKDLEKLLSYVKVSGYSPSEVEALLKLYEI
ncbi:RNA polymerase II-associated protein 3 [Trichonephila clavata]|uniref:RNA polymerase II-associated protein 3 n=1 Tax=Trichonephila clavata TaxID=2740835 RepID=A0A8X6I8W5_TRICU|nr:RNA polymerase II-associated protein 3 [Trichonephila clavata]